MINLRVIALAMITAENATLAVPAAIVDADGKPLLSWRVAILPYLDDGGRALFEEFHLDEPWDSDHNKKLIPRMPAVFAAARVPPDLGLTGVVVPAGPGMAFGDPDGTVHIGGEDGPPATAVRLRSLADGLSQTAFVIAIPGLEVPWTQPIDHTGDPAELFAALKQKGVRCVTVVAADGPHRGQARGAEGVFLEGRAGRVRLSRPPLTGPRAYSIHTRDLQKRRDTTWARACSPYLRRAVDFSRLPGAR